MAATKNTATASAVTTDRLRDAIMEMDAAAQEGFSRIEALARVALMALETPDAHRSPEVIMQTLDVIASIAQTNGSEVTGAAEEVGCNWTKPADLRRMGAQRAARGRDAQNAGGPR